MASRLPVARFNCLPGSNNFLSNQTVILAYSAMQILSSTPCMHVHTYTQYMALVCTLPFGSSCWKHGHVKSRGTELTLSLLTLSNSFPPQGCSKRKVISEYGILVSKIHPPLGNLAEPLHPLMCYDVPFQCTPAYQDAFNALKAKLIEVHQCWPTQPSTEISFWRWMSHPQPGSSLAFGHL